MADRKHQEAPNTARMPIWDTLRKNPVPENTKVGRDTKRLVDVLVAESNKLGLFKRK